MYCANCGSYIQDAEANFCEKCGTPTQKIDNSQYTINHSDTSALPLETDTGAFKPAFKNCFGCIVSFIVVIAIIIGIVAVLFTNNDSNNNPPIITDDGDTYNIQYEWNFRGYSWEYNTEIPKSQYDYFTSRARSRSYDEYVINPNDDEWMENLANLFIEEADEEGWDKFYYVPFALSFVQSLPYTSDEITTGYDEYPRYPVETLVDGGGDCEDTSILFASIVREMGYGVALLLLEDDRHMAVGIKISQSYIDSWDEKYQLTYYRYNNEIYAYCETTSQGWGVGEMPGDLVGTAEIIDVF